ncbi:hypothetical protein PAPHI01_1270 [Pancytospora philotis]|nr:hypothetical protein PAPHI01_1270 [Pancytospora philotis]
MDTASASEVEYAQKSISAGVRPDGRALHECRPYSYEPYDVPLADRSLVLQRGLTRIVVSATIRSSAQTLEELRIAPSSKTPEVEPRLIDIRFSNACVSSSAEEVDLLRALFAEGCHYGFVADALREALVRFKVGLSLEVKIVQDDGNLYDLVIAGIHELFTAISVPDIHDLDTYAVARLDLPVCHTYCIVNGAAVADPSALETAASAGRVRVFRRGDAVLAVLAIGSVSTEDLRVVQHALVGLDAAS